MTANAPTRNTSNNTAPILSQVPPPRMLERIERVCSSVETSRFISSPLQPEDLETSVAVVVPRPQSSDSRRLILLGHLFLSTSVWWTTEWGTASGKRQIFLYGKTHREPNMVDGSPHLPPSVRRLRRRVR